MSNSYYEAYELGYTEGHKAGEINILEEQSSDDNSLDFWLESLRHNGINILEPFQCYWDAAEQRQVVVQQD